MECPIVDVKQGRLKGQTCKTSDGKHYFAFREIPYATPPIGELRFACPVPPSSWEGIRDASRVPNACSQAGEDGTYFGNEDCLYLNVYTPKLTKPNEVSANLPVMVFIHGGGFVSGDGTDDSHHGPDYFVLKDMVVVGFNYRLGILGFYCLHRKDAPGNMGLRDQVLALKWVQENISKFNGNLNNVTIFGISAGGASVEYLMLSPMAKGLFHRAIAQSGSSLLHWARNTKIKQLSQSVPAFVSSFNQENIRNDFDGIKCLKSLPVKELMMASIQALKADYTENIRGGLHFGFVPTVEQPDDWEPFLDKPSYELLSKGEFTRVPYLCGFNDREGLIVILLGRDVYQRIIAYRNYVDIIPFPLDEADKAALDGKLKDIYWHAKNTKYDDDGDYHVLDFFTDAEFFAGMYVAASLIAKHNLSTYFYEFECDGKLNYVKNRRKIDRMGACHGDEGGYIFKSKLSNEDIDLDDALVRDRMVAMWTNFATYGYVLNYKPNPEHRRSPAIWEPIGEAGVVALAINKDLSMRRDLYPDRIDIYTKLYSKYRGTI